MFALAGTLALLLYGQQSLQHERNSLRTQLAIQANFTATSAQAFFDNIGNSLELATRLIRDKRDLTEHREMLRQILIQHPEISFISTFDAQGHRLVSASRTLGTVVEARQPWRLPANYTRGLSQMLVEMGNSAHYSIGRVRYGSISHDWINPFYYARRNRFGQISYIVVASIPVSRQTALWNNLKLLPNTRIGMYRDDGFIQARWPEAGFTKVQVYGTVKPPQSPMEAVVKSRIKNGFYEGYNSTNGDTRLGAYARLSSLPLTAFVSVPAVLAYQNWWRHNYALLVSSAISLGLFIGFALILLRREHAFSAALMAQANTDGLTGLPNRQAAELFLAGKVAQADAGKTSFAVLFIDLDRFKAINDNFGHDYGDIVLKQVAHRLKPQFGENDLLARLGGDEFMAVVDYHDVTRAHSVARHLLAAVKKPFIARQQAFHLTISIGGSVYPTDGRSAGELLKHADIAMYSVKNARRNGYAFFMDRMQQQVSSEMVLRQELEQAIQDDAFELHYQPKYNLDGAIVGCEALVRWQHPQRGLVLPGEFVPFAEETGLIIPLGEKVLRMACGQVSRWGRQGHKTLQISVNVSPLQLEHPDFVHLVGRVLFETGINPAMLELEVTETALANDVEQIRTKLTDLTRMGVRISLDDFGTGYSSLSYLKQLPIQTLKIDRSFVRDITVDADDAAIINAVIAMSQALDLKVVAEGVETEAQMDYLKAKGCHEFQGYYLARPMDVTAMDALLQQVLLAPGEDSEMPAKGEGPRTLQN